MHGINTGKPRDDDISRELLTNCCIGIISTEESGGGGGRQNAEREFLIASNTGSPLRSIL